MPWNDPRTWIAGEEVLAALMNQHVRDNLLWLHSAHTVEAQKTATQTVSVGATGVAVTFGGEAIDTDGFHDPNSNTSRLTVPASLPGIYLVYFNLARSAGTGDLQQARIKKNGTTFVKTFAGAGSTHAVYLPGACHLSLVGGDYIELCVDESGVSSITLAGDSSCAFGMSWRGA
jgi:hypothetical protein